MDLKADRSAGVLSVRAAWLEGEAARGRATPGTIAAALAADLVRMATWLELSGVSVHPQGDLSADLAVAVAGV